MLRWGARLALGIALLAAAAVLAFRTPPRFYALFVLGSWLAADALEEARFGTSFFTARHNGARGWLFAAFFVGGLTGDALLGLRITELWTYPSYRHALDWLLLYAVVYPVGGLSTYALLRAALGPRSLRAPRPPSRARGLASVGAWVALALVLAGGWVARPEDAWLRTGVFGLAFALQLAALEGLARARGSAGPLTVLAARPSLAGGVLALSALAALLHELPNVPGHEWLYTNLPFDAAVLGIPLVVIAGWPILLLFPWAVANALVPDGADPYGDRAE